MLVRKKTKHLLWNESNEFVLNVKMEEPEANCLVPKDADITFCQSGNAKSNEFFKLNVKNSAPF